MLELSDGSVRVARANQVNHLPAPLTKSVSSDALEEAKVRALKLDAIGKAPRTERAALTRDLAVEQDVNPKTVYRWLAAHRRQPKASTQLRKIRSDANKRRLKPEVLAIVDRCLKKLYLRRNSVRGYALLTRINNQLTKSGHEEISYGSVLKSIHAIPYKTSLKRLYSSGALVEARRKRAGRSRLGSAGPLSVVMMDHTKADVMLVDTEYREPIARAYLTIVLDLYSKMVLGFYISLDPVGFFSTGMALFHAIVPKTKWLAERDIPAEWWPCEGLMQVIHTDNATEFKGTAIKAWADENLVSLLKRRKLHASDGGAVESSFKTFMHTYVHTLPGTTFSNPVSKYSYDSEGNALLTIDEFEMLFTLFIVTQYHQAPHSGNGGLTPQRKWFDGIRGFGDDAGIGLPEVPANEKRLWVTLLPQFEATYTNEGALFEYRHYWSDQMESWIGARDGENRRKARVFTFHYDPRRVNQRCWFIDPLSDEIIELLTEESEDPPISIWQSRSDRRATKKRGKDNIEKDIVNAGLDLMEQVEKGAAAKNRSARLSRERSRDHRSSRAKVPEAVHPTDKELEPEEDIDQEDYEQVDLTKTRRRP